MPLLLSPRRLPTRLPAHHPSRRWIAALVIASVASAAGIGARMVTRGNEAAEQRNPLALLDDLISDNFYRLRPTTDRTDGDVVIVTVDDSSLAAMKAQRKFWPWPRDVWGFILRYLDAAGARAVVFDMVFEEPSVLSDWAEDDAALAAMIDATRVPLVMGTVAKPGGELADFVLPVKDRNRVAFGAVNFLDAGGVIRTYATQVHGVPTLAVRAAQAAGAPLPEWARGKDAFRLHYHGPHAKPRTYKYVPASSVFFTAFAAHQAKADAEAAAGGDTAAAAATSTAPAAVASTRPAWHVDPSVFAGKVVLIGSSAAGTYDLKASPFPGVYPGVEANATAVDNLLHGDRVVETGQALASAATFGVALLASLAVLFPRSTSLKLGGAVAVVVGTVAVSFFEFRGQTIHWLPQASPLLALLLSTFASFGWTYLTEGRQRQFILGAFARSTSPEIAAKVERNPDLLHLGGERREATVMFTDIAGFTDLSEAMEVERLVSLMNYYLEEMSAVVKANGGYVDKYIGDAIMGIWNAVVDQDDHAARACRTALALQAREREMKEELTSRGAGNILTRIGVNTGTMSFGNMGSSVKLNYTALGDSVNLGSRLEGANKLYGSQILIAQTTADRVRGQFVMRQLDVLRVKGKKQPMPVYEVLSADVTDETLSARVRPYEEAFGLYERQRWDEAEAVLTRHLAAFPDDAPAAALLSRVRHYREEPPGADWDGVYVAKGK